MCLHPECFKKVVADHNDNDDVDSVGAGARDIVDTGSAVAMQRLNIV